MTKRDSVTGMTDAELAKFADEAYERRNDPDAWEAEEAPEISSDVRSVVSVRFSRGELGPIDRAAAAAGVPVSTYIRNAALSAASTVDIEEARRSVEELQASLTHLASALGAVPGATSTNKSRKRTRSGAGKRAVA